MLTEKTYHCRCADCGHDLEETSNPHIDCPKCGGPLRIIARWGKCQCGEIVEYSRFTSTCVCGRDYNGSGELLASREQWGEETGESVADILSVDCARGEDWDLD